MTLTANEIRDKDVINLCDGRRLGYVNDFLIDCDCGRIVAIFVSEASICFADRKKSVKICWENVKCIGEDTILVDIGREYCHEDEKCRREGKKKGGFLFG